MNDNQAQDGNQNAGNQNAGNQNAGNQNLGNQNDGNQNAGNQNTGNQNAGNQNTGNQNVGNQNDGNQNDGNQNAGNQNAGNQNPGNQNAQAGNTKSTLVYCFGLTGLGLILARFVGIAVYVNEEEYDPKIFEKFDVPHDLWKTLISAKDDPTNTERESNENFQTIWVNYFKAKSYVANYRGELTTDVVNNFSQFSTQMEKETRKILGRTFGVGEYQHPLQWYTNMIKPAPWELPKGS